MAVVVTHTKVSGIADGGDASLVRPSDWNANHSVAGLDAAAVGLGNVDNTSDADKPVSTATATALSGKEPAIAAGTAAQYWRGDKSWQTLPPAGIGEAPNDGQHYARQSLGWTAVVTGDGSITNAKLADMPAKTVKMNPQITAGVPGDWSMGVLTDNLRVFSAAGNGVVPNPVTADITNNRLLRADATWVDPPAGGLGTVTSVGVI
ncbi:MAG TPA: hypothetical protein VJ763_10080, partial [Sphingomicrobium sp.]|nr:hypothetical protein [Sphingomicrobium sp.]